MIWTTNILQFCWRMDRRFLKQNYNESLAMSLLEILCSSRSLYGIRVLCLFSIFESLWWKLFGALETWIYRVSLICGFLKFLETFELDSNELWDLERWFGWFSLWMFFAFEGLWRSFSGLWRLESVELHQFVVSWSFWRLLNLILVTFEI